MKIHQLYVDKNGESHFEDAEVELEGSSRAGRLLARLPTTGIIFREVPPDDDLAWHPAPRRQYIMEGGLARFADLLRAIFPASVRPSRSSS